MLADERRKLDWIRAQLPSASQQVFFDVAACGPLPRCSVATLARCLEAELTRGREALCCDRQFLDAIERWRQRLARWLGARPRELLFTTGSDDAIATVLGGRCWREDEEIITSTHERAGGLFAKRFA